MAQKMDLQILDQSIVPAHPHGAQRSWESPSQGPCFSRRRNSRPDLGCLTPWRYQGHGHSCCLHSRRTHWSGPWRSDRGSLYSPVRGLVDGEPSHDLGAGRNSGHGMPPYPVDVFKDGTSGSNAITFLKGYHATGKVWISITRQRSGKFPNALRRLAIDDKLSMLSSASSRFFRPVKLFYHIAQMAILTFINSLKSWQKQREIFRFSSVTIPIILGIIVT